MDARQNFDKMAGGEWEAMLRCCAIYCRPAVDSEEGLKTRAVYGIRILQTLRAV